ncbi:MAG: DUF1972 domain-containing protein [Rikenellaceae bacterium]
MTQKRVAIIGTVGVPAAYGGFETLVENIIGENASKDIEYTIFCSSKDCPNRLNEYKGAKLKYIGLHANGIQSIIYDGLSLMQSIRGYDVVVALGVSGGIFFPFFRLLNRRRFIVNIDGLEWKRDKWGGLAKFILHLSERLAVRFADVIIADNQGIVDHVESSYNKESRLIAYGGDHVVRNISDEQTNSILAKYGVERDEYAITVCRIEPENNCDKILKAFAESKLPLIFIGNWAKSEYGASLKDRYSHYSNINIIDAVYDLDTLYVLRSNSKYYIHGHSAGGTNPSLVEAMYCRCNIVAYDVIYNRETTENAACYFSNEAELISRLTDSDSNGNKMYNIAQKRYCWSIIAKQYEELY